MIISQGVILISGILLTFLLIRQNYLECKRGSCVSDRKDIQCEIQAVPFKDISPAAPGEENEAIRARVIKAR